MYFLIESVNMCILILITWIYCNIYIYVLCVNVSYPLYVVATLVISTDLIR